MDVLTVVMFSITLQSIIIVIIIMDTTHCAITHMNFVIIVGILIFTTIMGISFMVLSQIAVSCCLDTELRYVNKSNVRM